MASTLAEPAGALLLAQDMAAPLSLPFAGGEIAVYSARCPEEASPNEDAVGLFDLGQGRGVLAVADGAGGQASGASASRIALECLERRLDPAVADLRAAILDAVEDANREILELKVGAGTTLAALAIDADHLRCFHAGDSEILVVGQRGRLKQHTISHSPTSYAVQAGLLDELEALGHSDRHLVSNLLGVPDMRIEVGSERPLAPRDTAIVGSDGLFDNLTSQEIIEVIRAGAIDRAAAGLADLCRARMGEAVERRPSKPDDCTFVIFRRGRERAGTKKGSS